MIKTWWEETSQYTNNPTARWVGQEYMEELVGVEYPKRLEYLDEEALCELADSESEGVRYLTYDELQKEAKGQ